MNHTISKLELDIVDASTISDLTTGDESTSMELMPTAPSLTLAQLERDAIRFGQQLRDIMARELELRLQREELEKRLARIEGIKQDYFAGAEPLVVEHRNTLSHLSIAEACIKLFEDLNNEWLSVADLDTELRRRGKVCSKGSIDITLKPHPDFEVERRGKRNFYRLRAR